MPFLKNWVKEAEDAGLIRRFQRLAEKSGIAVPRMLISESDYPAAHAVSIIRPSVIVTRGLLNKLETTELDAVLTHELIHIRRRDALLTIMLGLLNVLQVFNPFAGLMVKLATREREKVCDAEATRITGDPLSLASGLLKIARDRTMQATESAVGGSVAERIAAVMDHGNYSRKSYAWLFLLTIAVTAALLLSIC